MKKTNLLIVGLCALLIVSCSPTEGGNEQTESKKIESNQDALPKAPTPEKQISQRYEVSDAMQAVITTDKGEIVLNLAFKDAPLTVANFVGLAEGTIKNTYKGPGEAYFDGLTFHRVVSNFVIQGGDPLGKGIGDPGYKFQDEFHPNLLHDRAGTLSMANGRPDGNGSQFFVTHRAIPHLNGRHSVFGYISEGMDVVNATEQGDIMQSVRIKRNSEEAKAFDAANYFNKNAKKS